MIIIYIIIIIMIKRETLKNCEHLEDNEINEFGDSELHYLALVGDYESLCKAMDEKDSIVVLFTMSRSDLFVK